MMSVANSSTLREAQIKCILCQVSWVKIYIPGLGRLVLVIMSQNFWSKSNKYKKLKFINVIILIIRKTDRTCLEETLQVGIKSSSTKLPGEIYNLDRQCQLIHGSDSVFCSVKEDKCKRLWCQTKGLSSCQSSSLPWADGTPCGKNRWCMKGNCTINSAVSSARNGGWGEWSKWTPCSLTCGGGVQESHRNCDNPVPENGGKYCSGSRKKYRSCNTQPCPPGTMDPREQQCSAHNGKTPVPSAHGYTFDHKWVPKYGCM